MATARRGKSSKPETAGVLFLRDDELMDEVDAWIAKSNAANPDEPQWNRSVFARAALRMMLRAKAKP